MEDKILEIIEKYAEFDFTLDEHTEYLNKTDFLKVTQEIVKLFAIPDVVGSAINSKKLDEMDKKIDKLLDND